MVNYTLIDIEQTNCRDGSTQYDLTFNDGKANYKTSTWHYDEHITTTLRNVPMQKSDEFAVYNHAQEIVGHIRDMPWLFDAIARIVEVADGCMDMQWNGDEPLSWYGAVTMAIDDTCDDRHRYDYPEDEYDRADLFELFTELCR